MKKWLKKDIVAAVFNGKAPLYIPWSVGLTYEATKKVLEYLQGRDLDVWLDNHVEFMGNMTDFFADVGNGRYRDVFGAVWDKRIDKDIGVVEGVVLGEPTLSRYEFPDPLDKRFFSDMPEKINRVPDKFKVFHIGFSLYERAWSLRGMSNLLMDFYDNPNFVRELFDSIADYNIAQIKQAVQYDIDAVYFGDDWGQQCGLQMGYPLWKEFIYPVLRRMYGCVRNSGKYVLIHSCGDVDELFDDLVDIGLNCFNPFQPEVMDVFELLGRYRGRLSFFGGLSTQRTLPYGSIEEVKRDSKKLLEVGLRGGLIFAPAHAIESDVPIGNIVAVIETLKSQENYIRNRRC